MHAAGAPVILLWIGSRIPVGNCQLSVSNQLQVVLQVHPSQLLDAVALSSLITSLTLTINHMEPNQP